MTLCQSRRLATFIAFASLGCEPSRLPPDVDVLAARYADARVSFEERCLQPQSLLGAFGREAEPTLSALALAPSRGEEAAAFIETLDDDRVGLDRDALERCVGTLSATAACPTDPPAFLTRAGCHSVFVGGRGFDEGCGFNGDCAPGLFCDARAGECGRCADDLRAAVVVDDLCAGDALCGIEAAPSVAGAACTTSCGAGPYPALLCVDGACVERTVADVGEGCDITYAAPFTLARLVHCRESDLGSSACRDLDVEDELGPVCVDLRVGTGTAAPFVPGAAVVSSAVVGGAASAGGPVLECAR